MNVGSILFNPSGDFPFRHGFGCQCRSCRPTYHLDFMQMHEDERLTNRVNALEKIVENLTKEIEQMKLTTKARKALPKKDFALKSQRKYPIEDKAHAVAAKSRATQQVAKGNLAPSAAAMIKAKANKVLKKKK